jgi:3-methyladenine DNA glycosylase AlkC
MSALYPEDIHPDKKGALMFKHLDEYVRAEVINALNLMYKDDEVEVVLKLMNHAKNQVEASCRRIIRQLNETGTVDFEYTCCRLIVKDTNTSITMWIHLKSTK